MTGPTDRRAGAAPGKGPGPVADDLPEALRQAWNELPNQEPPELVDQAVLNRARAAVDRPHSSRPWSFGWPHALTTAAIIVLGITLIIPQREAGRPGDPPATVPPAPTAEQQSGNDFGLEEERIYDSRSAEPESSARQRREAAPRSLASPAREEAVPAPMESTVAADAAITPEVERRLQAIGALVDAGDLVAAREALMDFKRDFPEADLPPELAALLEAPAQDPRP